MAKKRRKPAHEIIEIDLHGLRLQEALQALDQELRFILSHGKGEIALKVITGKGLHSGPGGSVLASEVHKYFVQRYAIHIVSVESSPHEVAIGGMPIRGHFSARLKLGRR